MAEEQTKIEQTRLEKAGLKDEFIFTPRGEDFCLLEMNYYQKCKECPRTPESILFCKQNQINMTLNKTNKLLQELLETQRR